MFWSARDYAFLLQSSHLNQGPSHYFSEVAVTIRYCQHRFGAGVMIFRTVLRVLRPQQWIKNLLVFAAPIAGNTLHNHLSEVCLIFLIFCITSSIGYVFNDWEDRKFDSENPKKRHRPFASGALSGKAAFLILMTLFVFVIVGLAHNHSFIFVTCAYLTTSLIYSKWFKRIPVVELVTVSACFVIRSVAGGVASGSPLSKWLFLVISFGALLVISGKRLGELLQREMTRKVLDDYSESFLRLIMGIGASGSLFGLTLWAFTQTRNSLLAQISVVPFAVCILRLFWILEKGKTQLSEEFPIKDTVLLTNSALFGALTLLAIYYN